MSWLLGETAGQKEFEKLVSVYLGICVYLHIMYVTSMKKEVIDLKARRGRVNKGGFGGRKRKWE